MMGDCAQPFLDVIEFVAAVRVERRDLDLFPFTVLGVMRSWQAHHATDLADGEITGNDVRELAKRRLDALHVLLRVERQPPIDMQPIARRHGRARQKLQPSDVTQHVIERVSAEQIDVLEVDVGVQEVGRFAAILVALLRAFLLRCDTNEVAAPVLVPFLDEAGDVAGRAADDVALGTGTALIRERARIDRPGGVGEQLQELDGPDGLAVRGDGLRADGRAGISERHLRNSVRG
jgi:hypothetical protein